MNTSAVASPIKISFCTTCANRLQQISQTFEANAAVVARHVDVEWVVVNFGSRDGLDSFMQERLPQLSSRVVYARELSGRPWHSSVAKNVAHRLATGSILVNLDCDNFIGDAIEITKDFFSQGCRLLHLWSGVFADGTYGRICISAQLFRELGGYDESFYPMGYQDSDLIRRAFAFGALNLHSRCASSLAIRNTKEDSIRSCAQEGFTWRDYNDLNMEKSYANVAAGRLVANSAIPQAPLQVEIMRGGSRLSALGAA